MPRIPPATYQMVFYLIGALFCLWNKITKAATISESIIGSPGHVFFVVQFIFVLVSVHRIIPINWCWYKAHTYQKYNHTSPQPKIILLQKYVRKDRSEHQCQAKLLLGSSSTEMLSHATYLQCETNMRSDGLGAWSFSIHSFFRAVHCCLCYFHAHHLWHDYCCSGDTTWK